MSEIMPQPLSLQLVFQIPIKEKGRVQTFCGSCSWKVLNRKPTWSTWVSISRLEPEPCQRPQQFKCEWLCGGAQAHARFNLLVLAQMQRRFVTAREANVLSTGSTGFKVFILKEKKSEKNLTLLDKKKGKKVIHIYQTFHLRDVWNVGVEKSGWSNKVKYLSSQKKAEIICIASSL